MSLITSLSNIPEVADLLPKAEEAPQLDPMTPEEVAECLRHIRPLYWRYLVMALAAPEKTKGGIILADSTQEAQEHLSYVGKVIAMGGSANKHPRLEEEQQKPVVGEYIAYDRYSGMKIQYLPGDGRKINLRFLNDDAVLGVIADPTKFKIYI